MEPNAAKTKSDVLLDVKDLNIRFKTKKGYVNAVEHLDFQVKKGELLYLIEPAQYRIAQENAQAQLDMMKARRDNAASEFGRIQQLYGEKSVWVRPLEMFLGAVERDGRLLYRVEEEEPSGEQE